MSCYMSVPSSCSSIVPFQLARELILSGETRSSASTPIPVHHKECETACAVLVINFGFRFHLVFQDSVDYGSRCFSSWILALWHSPTAMESVCWPKPLFSKDVTIKLYPVWDHFLNLLLVSKYMMLFIIHVLLPALTGTQNTAIYTSPAQTRDSYSPLVHLTVSVPVAMHHHELLLLSKQTICLM